MYIDCTTIIDYLSIFVKTLSIDFRQPDREKSTDKRLKLLRQLSFGGVIIVCLFFKGWGLCHRLLMNSESRIG